MLQGTHCQWAMCEQIADLCPAQDAQLPIAAIWPAERDIRPVHQPCLPQVGFHKAFPPTEPAGLSPRGAGPSSTVGNLTSEDFKKTG